jgi:biotin carboxylase
MISGNQGSWVLVLGYRKGLLRSLERLAIPYVLWTDKPVGCRGAVDDMVAPFPAQREKLAEAVQPLLAKGYGFGHVIASGEHTVFFASLLRRIVGARLSKTSVILRCRDKFEMKSYLQPLGIPMTDFGVLRKGADAGQVIEKYGLPLVMKQRKGSGSRGIVFALTRDEVQAALSNRVIVERHIGDADEFSVESYVKNGRIAFSNITEYYKKQFINIVPGGLDHETARRMLGINRKVIESLRIQWGMTHVEFFVKGKQVLFGEVAVRPPGGHIMDLITLAYGFDAWDAFVSVELDRPFDYPATATHVALGTILHPGRGQIKSVSGADLVRGHRSTREFKLKAKPGQRVQSRDGVGQEIGHILQQCSSRNQALALHNEVNSKLVIEMEC